LRPRTWPGVSELWRLTGYISDFPSQGARQTAALSASVYPNPLPRQHEIVVKQVARREAAFTWRYLLWLGHNALTLLVSRSFSDNSSQAAVDSARHILSEEELEGGSYGVSGAPCRARIGHVAATEQINLRQNLGSQPAAHACERHVLDRTDWVRGDRYSAFGSLHQILDCLRWRCYAAGLALVGTSWH